MEKIIEITYKAYEDNILNGTEEEKKRFFRIALENIEREARHAAVSEIYTLANSVQNMKHYQ